MKEVYFKQIMIADLQNKTARVQPFEKGLNVVTSIDNHVGKSSLLKGTLENKIILAQFVALFQAMEYFKTSATRFSFVVDSPRAKEASISSSKDILKMISQMEMLPQIILATIDYSEYDSEIETPANIIVLTEKRKLLSESDYVKNQDTIMAISELLKKQV